MTGKLRVLLADDYPGLLKSYRRLLEPAYSVIGSLTDGEAVIEAARTLQPDVIVIDFAMPGLNGVDACRQIRKIAPQSKVVLITAANDEGIAQAATDAGAAAFVSKYRAAEDLLRAIDRVCVIASPA